MRLGNCIVEILKNVLLWGYVIKVKIGGVKIGGLIRSCVDIEVREAFLIYGMEEGRQGIFADIARKLRTLATQ